jgi:hypothetical protein
MQLACFLAVGSSVKNSEAKVLEVVVHSESEPEYAKGNTGNGLLRWGHLYLGEICQATGIRE